MYLLSNNLKSVLRGLRTNWLDRNRPPLKLKEVWDIRIYLQIANRIRDLALFNLAIDSNLRSCDLVKLRVNDVI